MKQYQIVGVAALLAASLAGCGGNPPPLESSETVTVLGTQELPAPPSVDGGATIGALDKIQIEVFGVPELTREIQVDAGGGFSFPFVGTMNVEGRTPSEIERQIAGRLREGYVKDPVVSVNMLNTQSQTIAIEGAVDSPGIYPAAGRLSLLRALALAGSPSDYAYEKQVVIFREIDGMRYAGVYDLQALRLGQVTDPRIYANDLIVLGESERRRSIDRWIAVAPAFVSPLILLITNT